LVTKDRGALSQRSIVALRMVKEVIRLFVSCTNVTVTKDLLHAVECAHSEYAVFLENECKRELLEAEERKKREQSEETQRAKEKTKDVYMNS